LIKIVLRKTPFYKSPSRDFLNKGKKKAAEEAAAAEEMTEDIFMDKEEVEKAIQKALLKQK